MKAEDVMSNKEIDDRINEPEVFGNNGEPIREFIEDDSQKYPEVLTKNKEGLNY